MKKWIKIILYPLGMSLLVGGVFGGYFGLTQAGPHIYSKTYYAALVDKVALLQKSKRKKMVLVGGSNVAFGFDSSLLAKEFPDYDIVNFGLYAALGTKLMIDLSKASIGEGDLVFLLPETNVQSMSLYSSPINTLKATEDNIGILQALPKNDQEAILSHYAKFVDEKNKIGSTIEPTGVYQRKNFNEYGDISYKVGDGSGNETSKRINNVMGVHYDPTSTVDFSSTFFDEPFVKYVNDYASYIRKKKALLYFGFCPIDSMGVINQTPTTLDTFYWTIRQNFQCKVIGNPTEYILDPRYFYDSNFHCNDSGATMRTKLFAQDVYRDVFSKATTTTISTPPLPDYPSDNENTENSESEKCFLYENNETGYSLTGVKNEYKGMSALEIPRYWNKKAFNQINENCFEDCDSLSSLTIPTTIRAIKNGAFAKASDLLSIKIIETDPSKIQVDYSGSMTSGTSNSFKIYIPKDGYSSYISDYYWGAYSSRFIAY